MNVLINLDLCVKTFVHSLFAQLVSKNHTTAVRRFAEINLQMAYLLYSCLCKLSWMGESISTYMSFKFLHKPFE